jgi:tetratricopeptide (TPR) repeat protein
MKGCIHTTLIAALLLCAASVALAENGDDTAMAKEHYSLGLQAYKAGKYAEAIKELKKAYLLKRIPALLINLGATYRKMGDSENALYYYKKYLAEAPNARDKGDIEKLAAELEKERSGSASAGPPSETASEPTPPPSAAAWKHTPIDAAPPGQPLDVRVGMPVSKGVHVYVYYRGAGEADFTQVPMHRHGGEKVGRIPAEALSGKSLQYYVEGKDDKGNVLKSFGSAADPNIVRLDASAAPQVVAGAGGPELKGAAQGNDDEAAPLMGELAEKPGKSKKRGSSAASGGGGSRLGAIFFAGTALAAVGVAGIIVGGYGLNQAKSYSDVLTADSNYRDPMNGQPYKFTDPTAQPYDDKTVEQRGKFYNTLGIAMTVVGGVALVGGAALMIADPVLKRRHGERPRSTAWLSPAVGPTMAGVAGGATF